MLLEKYHQLTFSLRYNEYLPVSNNILIRLIIFQTLIP